MELDSDSAFQTLINNLENWREQREKNTKKKNKRNVTAGRDSRASTEDRALLERKIRGDACLGVGTGAFTARERNLKRAQQD